MARLTGVLAAAAACLAVTLATATAGCSSPAGAAGGAGGASSLTDGIGPITFAIGSDDISWLSPVLTAWNASHPDQRVTPLYLPEAANDQLAQLVTNLQAKSDAYDVIDLDVVWTAEFASAGWIIPLPARTFPLTDFLPPAVATAEYQGRLYAVPYYSNADLLYYRSDILAKAHQKPPTTWAELESRRPPSRPGTTWTATRPRSRPTRASRSTSPSRSSRPAGRSSPPTAPRSRSTRRRR
jgi:multiple sugar transport system substrate-binding protein